MRNKEFFPLVRLCELYDLEVTFFEELGDFGLIDLKVYQGQQCIHQDALQEVERIIRIHRDLHVNLEGIDVVLNMLRRQEELEARLLRLSNKLRRYEDPFQ
ncbi:MerR HTH family regulatory protein [Muriicola jejuensis]|uniref:MerR family transcriptional regulator n=1 Tax=Muriicola jejuensis TaxID=504488 RepID=A0A6P0U7A4_9FLAO|nr:chaperone modulator CbpM [Muriicola jejuensis]NER09017.1 MerR family transcriptional regulator [Muriicola jejuensis]SMP12089.1 MerR HTH family regulatory protein [Muriicola jejuensis]